MDDYKNVRKKEKQQKQEHKNLNFLVGKSTPDLIKFNDDSKDLTVAKFLTLMVIDNATVIIKEKQVQYYEQFESGMFSLRQWITYYATLTDLNKYVIDEEKGIYYFKCVIDQRFTPKCYRVIFKLKEVNGELCLQSLSLDEFFTMGYKMKLLDINNFFEN